MDKIIKITLLGISLFLLTSCDKVNKENYQKIETGMKYDAVIAILGEPSNCEAIFTAKSCQWGSDTKKINIKFIGDQAVLYASVGLQ